MIKNFPLDTKPEDYTAREGPGTISCGQWGRSSQKPSQLHGTCCNKALMMNTQEFTTVSPDVLCTVWSLCFPKIIEVIFGNVKSHEEREQESDSASL